MIQWIQYYWLILVLKKYIRQHKLPVTIHSTFPMIQLHTKRNWFILSQLLLLVSCQPR